MKDYVLVFGDEVVSSDEFEELLARMVSMAHDTDRINVINSTNAYYTLTSYNGVKIATLCTKRFYDAVIN